MPVALIAPFSMEGENVRPSVTATDQALETGVLEAAYFICDSPEDYVARSIISEHPRIRLLDNYSFNAGKAQALDVGIQQAKADGFDRLVLIDSDMLGLSPDNIHQLLQELDESVMAIGYIGIRRYFASLPRPLNTPGSLSGLRAIRMEAWDTLSDGNNMGKSDKRGFNEAVLNGRVKKLGLPMPRIAIDGVGHVNKFKKHRNPLTALRGYSSTYARAARSALWIRLEPKDNELGIEGEITREDQLRRAIGAHKRIRTAGTIIGLCGGAIMGGMLADPAHFNHILDAAGFGLTMTGYSSSFISNDKIKTYRSLLS